MNTESKPTGPESSDSSDAEAFVETWSRVWRGRDSDPQLYMTLLHDGCPLINPINAIKREDLPQFMEAVLAIARAHVRLLRRAHRNSPGVLVG